MAQNQSEIMRGSHSWERIGNDGVPEGVEPRELRTLLHAYNDVLRTMVRVIDESQNEIANLKQADADTLTKVGEVERRVFDGETGLVAKQGKRFVALMTSVLILVLSVAFAIAKDKLLS